MRARDCDGDRVAGARAGFAGDDTVSAMRSVHGVLLAVGLAACGSSDGGLADARVLNPDAPLLVQLEWIATSSAAPTPRSPAASAFDSARGELLVFGGIDAESQTLGDTWLLDTSTATWTLFEGPSPSARTLASAVYDAARGEVVLFGGSEPAGEVGDTWLWDGAGWRHPIVTEPPARWRAAFAYDPVRQRAVLFGGLQSNVRLADTWEWDGTAWTQALPAGSPSARDYATMGYDPLGGQILLWGGMRDVGGPTETWAWDGTTWTDLTATAGGPTGELGTLVSAPGLGGAWLVDLFSAATHQGWQWDGAAFVGPTSLPWPKRARAATEFDSGGGRLLSFGGQGGNAGSTLLGDTWAWDGTTATQLGGETPPPRDRHMVAYDPVGQRPLLFGAGAGGFTQSGSAFGDTWAFEDGRWQQLLLALAPSRRVNGAAATDLARGQVVVFGGLDGGGNALGDTWLWDGAAWTLASPQASPPARAGASMAYDAARQETVLFGGAAVTALADTWLWDGATWREATPVLSPPPRARAAFAYDAAREEVVMFGGVGASEVLGDTWTWNGTAWTERAPMVSPPARGNAVAAFLPAVAEVWLVGGQPGPQGDAWAWDGTTWRDVTGGGPTPRRDAAGAYDPGLDALVLFGGSDATGLLGDTWLLQPR